MANNLITLIYFVIWLFYVRQCAYWGSRRVIGAVNGLVAGMLLGVLGLLFIFSSRKIE